LLEEVSDWESPREDILADIPEAFDKHKPPIPDFYEWAFWERLMKSNRLSQPGETFAGRELWLSQSSGPTGRMSWEWARPTGVHRN